MNSIIGPSMKKSPVRQPPPPEPESEEQNISLGLVTAMLGLPDLTHMAEFLDHAQKIDSAGFKSSKHVNLNPRDGLDPRKALTPR